MKSVLLFDLGDTLIQYYRREAFPPLLKEGIRRAKEAIRQAGWAVPSQAEMDRRVTLENHEAKNGRVRPLENRLAHIFGVKRRLLSQEQWLDVCQPFLIPIFAISQIYADTLPALDSFREKGHRIGILSNSPWGSPSELWRRELSRYRLLERCDVSVFCTDVGWRKPAQPMFRRVLAHFSCQPEDCIFVGDNPRWDILGARRAGMTPVLIDRIGDMDK